MSNDYAIQPCGTQFCLYTQDGSKLLGRHSTEAAAEEQKNMLAQARAGGSAYSVPGVEIFKVGEHNGDVYTIKDLQDMVAASQKLDFVPAVKLGHDRQSGAPAYGYVSNIRLEGDSVLGDLTDLPLEVYQAILDKRYGRVSSEIHWGMKRAGQVFRRALSAVALLGQEIPGVAHLKPLYKSFDFEAERALTYEADLDYKQPVIPPNLDDLITTVKALSDKIDKLSEPTGREGQRSEQHDKETHTMSDEQIAKMEQQIADLSSKVSDGDAKLKTYEAENAALKAYQREQKIKERADTVTIPALRPIITAIYDAVIDSDTKVRLYTAEDKHDEMEPTAVVDKLVEYVNAQAQGLFKQHSTNHGKKTGDYEDAGVEVDRLAKEAIVKKEYSSYDDAFEGVLKANPDLKDAYYEQRDQAN